jgi:hypothetical protein
MNLDELLKRTLVCEAGVMGDGMGELGYGSDIIMGIMM